MSDRATNLADTPSVGVSAEILQVTDLAVSFNDHSVFEAASFSIAQAGTLAITGPSGAGKSSLLGAILGLVRPDSGSIVLFGQEVIGSHRAGLTKLRRRVGAIFQDGELFPELTPIENVALPARLSGEAPHDALHRSEALLDQLEVPTRRTSVDELSGGERQRVALARSLINSPDLLLADEPTGSLDARTKERVIDLIFTTAKGQSCALLLVTHDVVTARRADTSLVMNSGMLQSGPA